MPRCIEYGEPARPRSRDPRPIIKGYGRRPRAQPEPGGATAGEPEGVGAAPGTAEVTAGVETGEVTPAEALAFAAEISAAA